MPAKVLKTNRPDVPSAAQLERTGEIVPVVTVSLENRCTPQSVPIVVQRQKYLSSLLLAGQSTVRIALPPISGHTSGLALPDGVLYPVRKS